MLPSQLGSRYAIVGKSVQMSIAQFSFTIRQIRSSPISKTFFPPHTNILYPRTLHQYSSTPYSTILYHHKPYPPHIKGSHAPYHQVQEILRMNITTMPHATGYQHSDILLSQTPLNEIAGLNRARTKEALQEKNQYEGKFPAGHSSNSEPLSIVPPVSRYERGTERQRARLNNPFAGMSQSGPSHTTTRNNQQTLTKRPMTQEMATPHPKAANPAEITSSVGTCAPISSGPVFNNGTSSKSKKSSAPFQGQAEQSAQNMHATGSQTPARKAPTSPTSPTAANDSSQLVSHTTKASELPEAAGSISLLTQDTVSLYDDDEYFIPDPTAEDVDLAIFNFSVASMTSKIATQPTTTNGTKRKADVQVDIDAQGETKKMRPNPNGQNCGQIPAWLLNTASTSNVKKTYQSPYPPAHNTQFIPPIAALPAGGQNYFSGTQPSFGIFGPGPQTTNAAQDQNPAVNSEGVIARGFLPVAQTVQHINQGNVTYNIGQMTNVQNQYSGQTPRPPNRQHQRDNFQQPVTSQVHNPKTSENVGSGDTFTAFPPDYALYHSGPSSWLPDVDTTPGNTDIAFNASTGLPKHSQSMQGNFTGEAPQGQSLQPTSSVNAFNSSEYGVDEAARFPTMQQHMATVQSMAATYNTTPSVPPYEDYPGYSNGQQNDISAPPGGLAVPPSDMVAPPVKLAAGFSIQDAPQEHEEPHVPGSELDPDFKQPISLSSQVPDYSSTHNPRDMPYHVWQQGKDLLHSTHDRLKSLRMYSPQSVIKKRLFDPEELKWLEEQAKEGKQRHSSGSQPVSLEAFTYQFRQRYCWASDSDLKWRLNDTLLKLQKQPGCYRVTRNANMQPWIVNRHWQTVHLWMRPGTLDPMALDHAYWFDWSDRWKLSVVNKKEAAREWAMKSYEDWKKNEEGPLIL